MLAGAGMSSTMWDYQRVFLADNGFRTIGYDRRGHGRSDDPGTGYDYDTLAGDLAAVLEFHDVHDATLVAHSMAGGEVVRYLSRYGSARVAKIMLVGATLPFPARTEDNPNGVTDEAVAALRERWKRDFPQWLVELAPPFVGAGLPGCDVSDAQVQQGIADMLRTPLRAHLECNKTSVATDFRAELTKIAVPTLIVHGDRDVSAPIEACGRRQSALIPGSELIVYENAPHGLMWTHQDRLNADIAQFAKG
ncbi:MAG TPA: alpha/beta hydrolase [Pseudonocardiaceae bacterium]